MKKEAIILMATFYAIFSIIMIKIDYAENNLEVYAKAIFNEEQLEIDKNIVIIYNDNFQKKYILDYMEYGYFIENENEIMVVFKELDSPHYNGFNPIKIGILDTITNKLKSDIIDFHSDSHELETFSISNNNKKYIMYIGHSTSQGNTNYYGGLYDLSTTKWEKIHTIQDNYWNNKEIKIVSSHTLEFNKTINAKYSNILYCH